MLSLLRTAHLMAAVMVVLPAGTYRPLYGRAGAAPARVESFRLDRDPVSRGDFLAFVQAHPEWRRSRVPAALAERDRYLADWTSDLDAGDAAARRRPVTGVSWLAADAYCTARGGRLPTVAEWEYAAAASATHRDATRDPAFIQQLVSRYATRGQRQAAADAGSTNAWGIRGLHDFGWEWTADFDGAPVGADTHAAHAAHADSAHRHDASCAGAAVGATDPTNYPAFLRNALRTGLTRRTSLETLGFRCAR
jgi:formylglycine-generating enzyme required for sulfatase activity